jgi:hypothetical protein
VLKNPLGNILYKYLQMNHPSIALIRTQYSFTNIVNQKCSEQVSNDRLGDDLYKNRFQAEIPDATIIVSEHLEEYFENEQSYT